MGAKAKKAMKKQLNKAVSASAQKPVPPSSIAAPDFLESHWKAVLRVSSQKRKLKEDVSRVVYISRIPHGFYETEMQGFFGQFGVINRLRIVRNKKTGKSKHFGFIEFEDPWVEDSKIRAKPLNWVQIEHKRHNKERTAEEHKKLVEKVKKRDLKRQKRIEAAGI